MALLFVSSLCFRGVLDLTLACGRNAAQVQGSSMFSRIDADLFFELVPPAGSPPPPPPFASPSALPLLRARLGLSTDIATPVTGLKTRARPSPQHASRYLCRGAVAKLPCIMPFAVFWRRRCVRFSYTFFLSCAYGVTPT